MYIHVNWKTHIQRDMYMHAYANMFTYINTHLHKYRWTYCVYFYYLYTSLYNYLQSHPQRDWQHLLATGCHHPELPGSSEQCPHCVVLTRKTGFGARVLFCGLVIALACTRVPLRDVQVYRCLQYVYRCDRFMSYVCFSWQAWDFRDVLWPATPL